MRLCNRRYCVGDEIPIEEEITQQNEEKMKINNPFKAFLRKIHEERIASEKAETIKTVNSGIVIANDKNDPDNKIYIYVCGVPVALVCDIVKDGENCVLIDQVGEFVANIKKMYRNKLNGNKVIRYGDEGNKDNA